MADISTYLQKILEAVYGEEVRGSIHDALAAMNAESTSAMDFAKNAKDSAGNSATAAKASEDAAKQSASEAETAKEGAAAERSAAEEARDEASQHKDAAKQSTEKSLAAQTAAELAKAGAQSEKDTAVQAALAAQTSKAEAAAEREAAEAAKDAAGQYAVSAAANAQSAKNYSGKPPKPSLETKTWWIWDENTNDYVDTHISSELAGPQGIGILDIQLTSGDHSPGTTDVYTITLTNETQYTISIYNGRNGEGAGDVLGIAFDLTIPKTAWLDGQATIQDERLFALATHKYFIDSDESCRDDYQDCVVRAKDIVQNGYITFMSDTDPGVDLTVNVLRLELGANAKP